MSQLLTLLNGDAIAMQKTILTGSIDCCITSPPYWKKRDYNNSSQLGLESTPENFVDSLLSVFEETHRVLTEKGNLWVNMGDSYAAGGNGGGGSLRVKRQQWRDIIGKKGWRSAPPGYKNKDLTLVPFLLAFALREQGWYLRSTIIWWRKTANEPNRLDRPATSHEYLFLFTKKEDSLVRDPGEKWWSQSVWSIPTNMTSYDHPAMMPEELARRCILAGCPVGGMVLDMFGGSGTTGQVAIELGRRATLIELNPDYCALIRQRCTTTPGLAL